MQFDLTSDIHIDFWVDPRNGTKKQYNMISQLIEGSLLPQTPSNTLVIAGDIGHYNWQNKILFEVLLQHYNDIVWVFGNHDLYMVSNKVCKKFNNNSFDRLNDMVSISDNLDGVHYLNGDSIVLDGIKFGGAGGWYDYSYAKTVWGYSKDKVIDLWYTYLNDANLIKLPYDTEFVNNRGTIDFIKFCEHQKELLNNSIAGCDVVVTHVAPTWTHIPSKYNMPSSTFYAFDGNDLLSMLSDKAVWAFGHTHDPYFYNSQHGVHMACNPLGYPEGHNIYSDLSKRSFKTIDLIELNTSYDEVFKDVL